MDVKEFKEDNEVDLEPVFQTQEQQRPKTAHSPKLKPFTSHHTSHQNGVDAAADLVVTSPGDLVEDFEKDDGGEYEYMIDSGSESETFDDDFIELEYGEIEMGGHEDQWDDEGEKAGGLVVMKDEEAGLDDKEASLDDEQKKAMKELKRIDRRKWTKKQPAVEPFNMESDLRTDLRTVNLKVGQIFGNAKVFKEAAREHAIKQGRSIWFPCNEKFRVQGVCKCKLDSCSWSIWASCYEKNNPALMIKTLNDKHTCLRV
ncbi:hypothetical protein LWI28_002328 [Acer negundo]|uniref:Transposase MuDR plant domain-containing protein n=1 Tax=Acer negundo TaxID=4023 RepID=A0AAD5IQI7_ACENE|nr:hypothetical protein LWI28_002328 [Acer negundo]